MRVSAKKEMLRAAMALGCFRLRSQCFILAGAMLLITDYGSIDLVKGLIMIDLRKVFRDSLRLYFAPLVGAIAGACDAVKTEWRRIENERK